MLRDKIAAEARAQRELRSAGKPVPAGLRRYARIAGLLSAGVCGGGGALIFGLGVHYGKIYWGALLFLGVLAAMGLVQAILGRHLLTRR